MRHLAPPGFRATGLSRLAWCGLPLALGVGAALALLLLVGAPARPASAAAPNSPSVTIFFPGCGATIQACLNAAAPGTTLVISAGTYTTSLTLSNTVNLTGVSSATVILRALNNQRVLTVTSAVTGSVVISGITFANGHALGGVCTSGCGGAVYLDSGTHPQLTNLKLLSSTAAAGGGGLFATSAVTLTNVQVISNTSGGNGGGVAAGALLKVVDGFFRANTCTDAGCQGGGVYGTADVTLTGVQFVSNTAVSHGGGLHGELSAVVDGGLFQLNQCTDPACTGGGLSVDASMTLTNTQFLSNTSGSFGGGAYVQSVAKLSGGLFQANQCVTSGLSCRGGGLYSFGSVNMTGTVFLSNTAQADGGGLHTQSLATLNNGRFERNQCLDASCNGGGVLAIGTLSLTGTQFVTNTAQGDGGGVFAESAATLRGGLFQANQCLEAACNGGGLAASTTLALTGTQFLSNTAQGAGGALRHNSLIGRVVNALFAGNTATGGAGALSVNSPGLLVVLYATIDRGTGPAIEVLQGSLTITDSIITGYTIGISRTGGFVREANNLFFANTVMTQGTNFFGGGGDVTGLDPQYKSPATGNYHLRSTSPAQNIGVDVGVSTDVDGEARPFGGGFDAGYDEFVNHAPAAGGAGYSTPEETALHVAAPGLLLTGSDSDGDSLKAALAGGPATGTLALSANGAVTYTPPLNFNGPVTFTYVLSDGLANSAPAVATIDVTPVNDAPTLTALASLTVPVGTDIDPLPFTVGDVEDAAAALTMTATSSNHALLADDHIGVSGSGADRNLLLVPVSGQVGSTLITLVVHDSQGGTASRAFALTVTGEAEIKAYLPLVVR
jgi:hypothetical protein